MIRLIKKYLFILVIVCTVALVFLLNKEEKKAEISIFSWHDEDIKDDNLSKAVNILNQLNITQVYQNFDMEQSVDRRKAFWEAMRSCDISVYYLCGTPEWAYPELLYQLAEQVELGLFQSMVKHRQMFINPAFGLVGVFSYFYYLLYELLSSLIEVFGMIITVLAWSLNLINIRFMIFFYLAYAFFGCVMTLTAFFARIYTQNITLSFLDVVKAVVMCLIESVFLRFVMAYVRITAFVGYRSRKRDWGRIQRQKINIK